MGLPPVIFLKRPIFLPAVTSRKRDRLVEARRRDLVMAAGVGGMAVGGDRTATPAIICGELGCIIGDLPGYPRYPDRVLISGTDFYSKTLRLQHKSNAARLDNLMKMIAAFAAAKGPR